MSAPDKLAELRELNAYRLANIADCATPDKLTSPGAALLLSVRDGVAEYLTESADDRQDPSDAAREIADGAPSVYTYTCWQEFVDLAAWREDDDDGLAGDDASMEDRARVALYMIAERLAVALIDEYATEDDEGEDDEA